MSGDDLIPTREIVRKATEPVVVPASLPWWRILFSANMLGIGVLLFACGWSLMQVLSIKHQESAPGVKTIRIAHWQLESGYRDAMQAVIDDYNTLHQADGVRVVQMPVTERVYAQWLNVNLISDTAPDLAEMGMSKLVSSGETVAKYFVPLGQHITKPNPYNAIQYLDELSIDDPAIRERLATAPWRETVVDGMRGGYKSDLQDYYSVATSFFTTRMFYNKDLMVSVTGSDKPPKSLGQLFAICEKMRAWAKDRGLRFDPIAATKYHRDQILGPYRVTMTSSYAKTMDTDLSGDISPLESWAGFQAGKVNVGDPPFAAYWEVALRICGLFNPQFAALERDMAIADFAQGRAAFMASGSWDAQSVFAACKFEVGVMTFPLPAAGEPYSEFGTLPLNEAGTTGGGSFGLTKTSKHPEIAIDFLRFLSSHKWNQRLNQKAGWLPVTIGAIPDPKMSPFMPNPYGVAASVGFDDGFDLAIKVNQNIDLYLGREIDFDTFRTAIDKHMADPVIGIDRIWAKNLEKTSDNVRSLERTITVNSFRVLVGTGSETTPQRLRETILDQALNNNGGVTRVNYERQNKRPLSEGKP